MNRVPTHPTAFPTESDRNLTIAGSPLVGLQPNLVTHTAAGTDPTGGPYNYEQSTYAPNGLSDGVRSESYNRRQSARWAATEFGDAHGRRHRPHGRTLQL